MNPENNPGLKIQNDQVMEFPRIDDFEAITLKAEKVEVVQDVVQVSRAQRVD